MADRKPAFDVSRRNFIRGAALTLAAAAATSCAAPENSDIAPNTVNPFTELVDQLPRPEYFPPMERQTVSVHEVLPVTHPETPEAAANQLRADLFTFKGLLSQHQDDPQINPHLGQRLWNRAAPELEYLQDGTLLELVTNACTDAESGSLHIVASERTEEVAFMQNYQLYGFDHRSIYVTDTIIEIPPRSTERIFQGNLSQSVPPSNIMFLAAGLYEYASRMSAIGMVVMLNNHHYSDTNPPQDYDLINRDIANLQEALYAKGHRRSADQNIVQFAVARSLAALGGDSNAKVIGLEPLESLGIYPNYIAALNGDQQALAQLQYDLSVGAGY